MQLAHPRWGRFSFMLRFITNTSVPDGMREDVHGATLPHHPNPAATCRKIQRAASLSRRHQRKDDRRSRARACR